METPSKEKDTKLPYLYFNEYVAGSIRGRQDFEAINGDLLYFCLLMKMNQYAKEVYFLRKASRPEIDVGQVYEHLKILRKFCLDFYEIPAPNYKMIQNELTDPIERLDSLPVDGTGKKVEDLGTFAEKCSLNPKKTFEDLEELDLVDEADGEASPRRKHSTLSRESSIVGQESSV
jgi:hypothetical protein